ncbi:MAG: peptide chain release factor N(5)-glutamine methyltransferase [Alphaproteobacteria bacterium]|nr:peptide chain release factor N(5)-glutamine methyltransferase [Alphaproteobacteria bacterium]
MELNQAFSILQSAGGTRAARIITDKYKKLSRYKTMYFAKNLRKGVPVAKLIHSKWFFGLDFYTNKWTLDPRPDTETLVESVIKDYKTKESQTILDIGTGTGCIICALCKNLNNLNGIAIDKSYMALMVAYRNIKNLQLANQIKLKHCDIKKYKPHKKFNIIVSNPPYIKKSDYRVNKAANFDPKIALYAKDNGMEFYDIIAQKAKNWLYDNGKIYLEIGVGQTHSVIKIFQYYGWKFERTEKDLSGINRVVVFTKL